MEMKTNSGAIVGIVSGVAIIVLAIVMLSGANNLSISALSTSSQFQLSYSFGADFYTEMYGVTYNILKQLGDMSSDNAANIALATNTITKSLGYTILAIGLGVLGLSFCKLKVWIPKERNNVSNSEPQLNGSFINPEKDTEESTEDLISDANP